MVKKTAANAPDAWEDDDWEAQADKAAATGETAPAADAQAPLSKKERMAQHAESNRKLWESAEAPTTPNFHYLASCTEPPLSSTFKPAVTVLSRRPAPQVMARRQRDPNDPAGDYNDDDDDDDENGSKKKKVQLTPEEVRAKQLREREEKQRRYDEARAKIFGTAGGSGSGSSSSSAVPAVPAAVAGVVSNPSSGTSTPGTVTPPRSAGDGRGQRGRGRGGRGGAGSGGGGHRYNDNRGDWDRDRDRDRDSSQRPGSQSGSGRELYDPNYSPKPGFQPERRGIGSGNSNNNNNNGGASLSGRSTPRDDDQVIRAPRGPDGSTRGFARRGAKAA